MLGQMMHRPLSIIEILKFAAEAHPRAEMVSVRTEGDIHRQTYADSLRRVGQLAHALKKLGVAPGARIATLAWNGYRHFELYYAISGIGAVCHTINPRLSAEQNEWTPLIRTIETAKRNKKRSPSAAKELKEQLVAVAPIFEEMPYFMSEEFSLVDCTVAPILWRLPHLGVELPPKQTRGLQDYQYRMFNRDAFQASLSEAEREMPRS